MGSQFLIPLDHYVNFRLARCFGSLNRETYRRAPWLVRESLAHQYRISTSGSSCLPKDAHIMNDCLFSLATLDGNRSSHALRHFNSRVGNGAGTLMFRLPGESPGEPITSLSLGCSSNSWQSQSEEEPVRYAKALSTMPHDVRSSVATSSAAGKRELTPPRSSVASSSVKESHLVELDDMADGACDLQSLSLKAGKKALRPQNRSSDESAGGVNLLD